MDMLWDPKMGLFKYSRCTVTLEVYMYSQILGMFVLLILIICRKWESLSQALKHAAR